MYQQPLFFISWCTAYGRLKSLIMFMPSKQLHKIFCSATHIDYCTCMLDTEEGGYDKSEDTWMSMGRMTDVGN